MRSLLPQTLNGWIPKRANMHLLHIEPPAGCIHMCLQRILSFALCASNYDNLYVIVTSNINIGSYLVYYPHVYVCTNSTTAEASLAPFLLQQLYQLSKILKDSIRFHQNFP